VAFFVPADLKSLIYALKHVLTYGGETSFRRSDGVTIRVGTSKNYPGYIAIIREGGNVLLLSQSDANALVSMISSLCKMVLRNC
jgi:hypothetical protein